MTDQSLAANTAGKSAASTAAGAIIRAVQAGVSKKITMIAAVVEALSAASTREFCKALGIWHGLAKSAVAVPLTGTTAETALVSIPIPAGAMGPNGVLRITTLWSHSGSANAKSLRYRLGENDLTGAQLMNVTTTATLGIMLQRMVFNRASQASQITQASANAASFGTFAASPLATTVDTSIEQSLVISGQLVSAGETITLESYLVEVLYGA
jgi:hypothetical protein